MKKIIGISTTFLLTILLTACGGGGSDGASTSTPSTPGTQSDSGTLIIDNGRGTTNNQDTERVN